MVEALNLIQSPQDGNELRHARTRATPSVKWDAGSESHPWDFPIESMMVYRGKYTHICLLEAKRKKMQIKEFEEQLRQWEARYDEWSEPVVAVVRASLLRVNRDGYTLADFERDRQAVVDQQRAKYDPDPEIDAIVDRMCAEYLTATPEEQEQCRAAVSDKGSVQSALQRYVSSSADDIRSQDDVDRLRRALAAVSIENCATDFRDVFMVLAKLFVAAERAGIDPVPYFRAVAELSSRKQPRGGTEPVAKLLRDFPGYAIVAECRASAQWPPPIHGTVG